MAVNAANVLVRVEPDVKEQAEAIMARLGVSASTVINMLYKQINITRSIPFSLSIPDAPIALDEMDTATFDSMMGKGLAPGRGWTGHLSERDSCCFRDIRTVVYNYKNECRWKQRHSQRVVFLLDNDPSLDRKLRISFC